MKSLVLALFLTVGIYAFAETLNVGEVKTGDSGTTTIEIKKGPTDTSTKSKWEVQDGTADVEGEASPLQADARKNWKKSCDSWMKEFRADNKENKIISLSCGTPACSWNFWNDLLF